MELASAQVVKSGNSLRVQHGDDKGLYVTFFTEPVESPFKSEQAGHPVFDDVVFIHIIFPGNRSTEVKRPAKLKADGGAPTDPQRWPAQYEAFKNQSVQVNSGMPVTEWAVLTKSQALGLKSMNIHTVEQLAEVPDHALTWMGAREMQVKAQAWLKNATDGSEVLRLKSENQSLRLDVDRLMEQVKELAAVKTKRRNAAESEA